MAEQKRERLECFDLQALPAPALHAVVSALNRKGGLLRTSTFCRDSVLAACKVAKLELHVNKDQSPKELKAHHPLLKRLCTTASPGLSLWLEAEAYWSRSKRTVLLSELLESEPPLQLLNVHKLGLQVTTNTCDLHGSAQVHPTITCRMISASQLSPTTACVVCESHAPLPGICTHCRDG
jgi:hypothetical protein